MDNFIGLLICAKPRNPNVMKDVISKAVQNVFFFLDSHSCIDLSLWCKFERVLF